MPRSPWAFSRFDVDADPAGLGRLKKLRQEIWPHLEGFGGITGLFEWPNGNHGMEVSVHTAFEK
jgi:hypothetical protein